MGTRSTSVQFIALSVAILLLIVLHRLVLLDWMLLRPFLASGIVLALVFLGAVAAGAVDPHTLVRLVLSPLWTLIRYRWSIAGGAVLVSLSALLLEFHPLLTEWPGILLVCVTFAYLIRNAHAPRSVFHIVSGVANNVQIWNARQLDRLYRFFRGGDVRFEPLLDGFERAAQAPTTAAESRAIAEAWERDDDAARDTRFNVIGWYIAWQCLLLVVHSGNLFRVFHLQHEHAFELVGGQGLDPAHAWAWLLFGVDRLLFESELTFDVYDIYGIEDSGLWGLQMIRHTTAVSHVLFFLHITISVLLANTIFHHFAFGGHVQRLLRSVRLRRYQERTANRAYRSLRVLRPLIERRMIRTLQAVLARERLAARGGTRGWDDRWQDLRDQNLHASDLGWIDILTIVSLLRTRGARASLRSVVRTDRAPFQVRLAALGSLLRSGGSCPVADIVSVLEPLQECCDDTSNVDQFANLAWIGSDDGDGSEGDGRVLSEARIVRLMCHDLLDALERATPDSVDVGAPVGSAAPMEDVCRWWLGDEESRAAVDSHRAAGWLPAIVALGARAGDRPRILSTLSYRPRWAEPICDVFVQRGLLDHRLDDAELALFGIAARLLDPRVRPSMVVGEITTRRIRERDRPLITSVLLRVLDREKRGMQRSCLVDALARVGVGSRALEVLAAAWTTEREPRRWRSLLGGMERIGIGGSTVVDTAIATLDEGELRPDLRALLWRILCLQLDRYAFSRHFGIETHVNSRSMVLREIQAGQLRIGDVDYDVAPFLAADFPVRVRDWRAFVSEVDSGETAVRLRQASDRTQALLSGDPRFADDAGPVVEVSWWDAVAFCAWLTERERQLGELAPDRLYRLPTEVEWTWMAQARSKEGFWYEGDTHGEMTNHRHPDSPGRPTRRGELHANPAGIFAVHGNVWEWCLNEHAARDLQTQPPADSELPRALKGGSWRSPIEACSAQVRAGWAPGACLDHVGFRVVLAGVVRGRVEGRTGRVPEAEPGLPAAP
jgi:hypothetical protein